jgi:hypothetical protein
VTATSKRKIQRHSPDRLLRKPVALSCGVTISAEKHRGRLVVRVNGQWIEAKESVGPSRLTQ